MDMSEQLIASQVAQQEHESDRRRAVVALTGGATVLSTGAIVANQLLNHEEVFADYPCKPTDDNAYPASSSIVMQDESGNNIWQFWYKCPDSNTSVKATTTTKVTTPPPAPTTALPTATTRKPVVTQPQTTIPATTLPPTTTTTTPETTTTQRATTTTVEKTTTSNTDAVTTTEESIAGSTTSTTEAVTGVPQKSSGFMDQYGTEVIAGGSLVALTLVWAGLRRRNKNQTQLA